jgi:hypothetical protein
MDIGRQAEIVLRQAGYDTWPWGGGPASTVCFENEVIVGFVHVFSDPDALRVGWSTAQEIALARYATALRIAGDKAWNVYSVFLTEKAAPPHLARDIECIQEDFAMTRKIAGVGIATTIDITRVLLPLLPIQSRPVVEAGDYIQRLQTHLTDLPYEAVEGFLGRAEPTDIIAILAEAPP